MDESQILMDYTPPTWREWLFKFLDGGFELILLFAVFGTLSVLASGYVYQSPLGPVSGDIINLGFIFTLLQLMLWSLVEGIIEALSAWALWLTPVRAIISGLAVAIALWLWT